MAFAKSENTVAQIKPANIIKSKIVIQGTAPFVQNKFSQKSKEKMMLDQSTPKAAKKSKKDLPPRNYEEEFIGAQHLTIDGKPGIPCAAFRTAMIDACRTVGLVMTKAKMSVFIVPDDFDKDDGTPLVFLQAPKPPERLESHARNDDRSTAIRIRAMWRKWGAEVTVEYDADMITAESVVNLLDRAGRQVGVGEGRPFSKNSCGQNWGTFTVISAGEK